MELVSSFRRVLQVLAVRMSAPSFESFVVLVTGWIFAARRTVTGMIVAAGAQRTKHHSAFHRFFANASWSLDALGLTVFSLIEPWIEGTIFLAIDDTLARKRGLKIFGVGMHHDPLLSTRKTALTNWGHSWVVLGVLVQFPFRRDRYFCLPIVFRLYLNHKAAQRARRVPRTRPQLAVEMLEILCQHRKNRAFHVVADSTYGGQSVLKHLPANCDLTSRLHLDARLYAPLQERKPGTNGRPRKRGQRLPTPRQMFAGRMERRTLDLYGRRDRVRMAQTIGRWHCALDRPLRVVAVDPLSGGRTRQAFYSTCHEADGIEVLTWYSHRWAMEQTNQESKGHLGFEEPQAWTRSAVERTAPMAMLLYSLIVLWFASEGHRDYMPVFRPWYRTKRGPCFIDMLATLRRLSVRQQVSSWGLRRAGSHKNLQTFEQTLSHAA
jgi:hypothetical protein